MGGEKAIAKCMEYGRDFSIIWIFLLQRSRNYARMFTCCGQRYTAWAQRGDKI